MKDGAMSEIPAFATISFAIRDGIADLRLNRPEVLNAINSAMIGDLHRALDLAEADAGVRAIVISGEGRAFSAGFDLKESAARGETSRPTLRIRSP